MAPVMESPASACLDADTVLELLQGSLASEDRRGAEMHLGRCAECRGLVLELERILPGSSDGESGLRTQPDKLLGTLPNQGPGGVVAGRYVLTGLLGRGGMGVVYRAEPIG